MFFLNLFIGLIYWGTLGGAVSFGSHSFGTVDKLCAGTKSGLSQSTHRQQLLLGLKRQLKNQTQQAIKNLHWTTQYLSGCSDLDCDPFIEAFSDSMNDQLQLYKISRAISLKKKAFQGRRMPPLKLRSLLRRIARGSLRPSDIARFRSPELSYSTEERLLTQKIWIFVFVRMAKQSPQLSLGRLVEKTRTYFENIQSYLVISNPILNFWDQRINSSRDRLTHSLTELIHLNEDFLRSIQELRTHHRKDSWSYINLTVRDHEMGLMNFPEQAMQVILKSSNRKRSCRAWVDLKAQQELRVNSSIGVGFASAIACGVGLWSGVGSIPSVAICLPALLDGMLGGYRGFKDARLAKNSIAAAREVFFKNKIQFSGSLRSFEEAERLEGQAQVVSLLNFAGLLPMGRAIALTSKGAKGSLPVLFQMPRNDLAASAGETHASGVATLTGLIRASEWSTEQIEKELSLIIDKIR